MSKAIVFTDRDKTKWRVWVRAWYQHKITNATTLKEFKQKAANEQRSVGRARLANAIERQTVIRWCQDSGILFRKERIVK